MVTLKDSGILDLRIFDLDIEGKLNEWADTMDKVYQSLSVYSPGVSNIGELSALKVTAETLRTLAEGPMSFPKDGCVYQRPQFGTAEFNYYD